MPAKFLEFYHFAKEKSHLNTFRIWNLKSVAINHYLNMALLSYLNKGFHLHVEAYVGDLFSWRTHDGRSFDLIPAEGNYDSLIALTEHFPRRGFWQIREQESASCPMR
jgi:hypothetical protein